MPNGDEHAAITHLPLLQALKEGDPLHILVDPGDPKTVKLPLLSELWATPLAYLLSGVVIVCSVLFSGSFLKRVAANAPTARSGV